MAQNAASKRKKEFESIMIQHMDTLYSCALWMTSRTGTVEDAQDLTQEAYCRAYKFFDRFQRGTNAKAWLFKVLKNVYINEYRKEARKPILVEFDEDEVGASDELALENEIFDKFLDDDVTEAMDALPEKFRLAIIVSDLEGFSYKETAAILGCALGTVMSRLHRGRKLLKKSLRRYARERGFKAA